MINRVKINPTRVTQADKRGDVFNRTSPRFVVFSPALR